MVKHTTSTFFGNTLCLFDFRGTVRSPTQVRSCTKTHVSKVLTTRGTRPSVSEGFGMGKRYHEGEPLIHKLIIFRSRTIQVSSPELAASSEATGNDPCAHCIKRSNGCIRFDIQNVH